MPEKVLIYSRFPKAQMLRFGEHYDLLNAAGQPVNEAFTADELAGIRAMITAGGTPLGGEAMDLLPKLGAIVCYGTGYDGIDLTETRRRNIVVGHSPAANAASVADLAMTLLLAAVRRLRRAIVSALLVAFILVDFSLLNIAGIRRAIAIRRTLRLLWLRAARHRSRERTRRALRIAAHFGERIVLPDQAGKLGQRIFWAAGETPIGRRTCLRRITPLGGVSCLIGHTARTLPDKRLLEQWPSPHLLRCPHAEDRQPTG